ncbi:MAG: phosphate acyltransferase PlsX [Syntrophorhabdaceae bacterium]|nr:phosphate acyltransferase PlsX [Syntrophorhabdaceae bacterium]
MVRIAVDGMGGDYAPSAIVQGAEWICREDRDVRVILVGNEKAIKPLLKETRGIEIIHTPVEVDMGESPSIALRKKRDSSMGIAFELVKNKEAHGIVTAGNSGAAMAFAIFTLGRIKSVDRPAIATLHPNIKGSISVLIDAGGNVDCKPTHLVQFAIMGDAFARCVLGIPSPKVGVLSNGEEESKGNELTRETHGLLKGLNLNYIGYVEGTDMYNGNADVVVSDGFVGNVALKISEGVADSIIALLKEGIEKKFTRKIGYIFLKDLFSEISRKLDFSEIGGAPLLGVDGVTVICHGKSNGKAIKNAIGMAKSFVEKRLNESIKETISGYDALQKKKEKKRWIIF